MDRLDGDDGNDRISAADGGIGDELFCGRGVDTAQLDANDFFANLGSDRCEQVTRDGLAGPIYFGDGIEPLIQGSAPISIACPGDSSVASCNGTARLVTEGRTGPAAGFARTRNDIAPVGVAPDATTATRVGEGHRQASTLVVTFTGPNGLPAENATPLL